MSGALRAREVLDFWFGAPGSAEYGRARKMWFRKDAAFDALLRERFGALLDAACAGELDAWCATPEGALALVIVLDQFSRNCHRGTPRAFAADDKALAIARAMVASGDDLRLPGVEHRAFAYLPFEHAETAEAQRESLRLFGELAKDPQAKGYYDYAVRHADVIARFGRFPHRNAQLGRESTQAEAAFLSQPGSRF
ncbi:uncharacterized protein (DUF924 family) [Paraburkholderia eburnea]|uniref:Uncharacterized protein (DUF924 family) n=1 Tax=Paraburkholderia eburnea TaxID=1189126 RepID=A0A2S4MLL6_9BURK|nr:DUF924 family protein [Paraburkholderia eburnea]POR55668.1 uncharacterized protein (DUF924 family) [Paraburkholderia eburnea]PRZ26796.1 uncharacterized protein (DUF924 family) [Paraburkholderia eburnea]